MFMSRKRLATARGKAPARNQNDAPDIPRFRDATAAENYMKSLPRKVASTKFVCKSTLISFGVLEGVTQLFPNIGWENLLNLMVHTYELPVIEFLSDCRLDNKNKKAAFQLLEDRRYIDFAVINDILGLSSSNTSTVFNVLPAEFNHETFWTEITRGIFICAGQDKPTSIIQPCLRISHRILVCTVFARKEAASGFVTLLARGLVIKVLDECQPVDNKTLLDERALTNTHHTRRRRRKSFTWYCPQRVGYIVLPDP
ncbi:unnamed protein product [Lactuca saligna]|uniref:Arabidopsis retrotransposon Orf1 C-terminal domain-containing protein n=1 Tax=Lactuca saligna TaxID=75948 RepID=A0AA35V028_LACSI|nr:unnamed protein product [Lactuca saligna]